MDGAEVWRLKCGLRPVDGPIYGWVEAGGLLSRALFEKPLIGMGAEKNLASLLYD